MLSEESLMAESSPIQSSNLPGPSEYADQLVWQLPQVKS